MYAIFDYWLSSSILEQGNNYFLASVCFLVVNKVCCTLPSRHLKDMRFVYSSELTIGFTLHDGQV